jgi:hypothetical protein
MNKFFSVTFPLGAGFAIEGRVHAPTGFQAIEMAKHCIASCQRDKHLRNGASPWSAEAAAYDMREMLDHCDACFVEIDTAKEGGQK